MAFGCTITVEAGKIPSSQNNLPWLAVAANFPTAAVDGGSESILNGGGNLRCYTDDTKTTQLSIDVVSFVTGGSPFVIIWGLSPTLNVATTVYIEADDVATTQPAVGDAFGRNSVWSSFGYISHDGITDSTGNSTITQTGSPTKGINPWGGDSVILNGSSQHGRANTSIPIGVSDFMFAWIKPASISDEETPIGLYVSSVNNTWHNLQFKSGAISFWQRNADPDDSKSAVSTAAISIGVWQSVAGSSTSISNRSAYTNGGNEGVNTETVLTPSGNFDRLTYGRRDDSTPSHWYDGEVSEMWVDLASRSSDFINTIHTNQNDPESFWSTSAWIDNSDPVQDVLDRMSGLDQTEIDAITVFVNAMVAEGFWDNVFEFYAPCLNAVDYLTGFRTDTLVESAPFTPTHTPKLGLDFSNNNQHVLEGRDFQTYSVRDIFLGAYLVMYEPDDTTNADVYGLQNGGAQTYLRWRGNDTNDFNEHVGQTSAANRSAANQRPTGDFIGLGRTGATGTYNLQPLGQTLVAAQPFVAHPSFDPIQWHGIFINGVPATGNMANSRYSCMISMITPDIADAGTLRDIILQFLRDIGVGGLPPIDASSIPVIMNQIRNQGIA